MACAGHRASSPWMSSKLLCSSELHALTVTVVVGRITAGWQLVGTGGLEAAAGQDQLLSGRALIDSEQ